MKDDNAVRRYHPALRILGWAFPLAAAAVIVFVISSQRGCGGADIEILPPESAQIPFVGHAGVDSLISGGSRAFEAGDYQEAARLLARARFFIRSGMNENVFDRMPRNLELALGLSEHYRGFTQKGIETLAAAAGDDPTSAVNAWYLALLHLSEGNRDEGTLWLKKAASMEGPYAGRASELLERL